MQADGDGQAGGTLDLIRVSPGRCRDRVTKLKEQDGGDLLVYGHGLLAETLLSRQLLDVLDISIHPIVAGSGKLLFRERQNADMKLVAIKGFSKIVRLTHEPQYES